MRATRLIDATGKVVAPGFIDLHSHSGLMILADPRHEPKVRQGVTTEIIGVDGLSYAPMPSTGRPRRARRDERRPGRPPGRLATDWDSVGEYLDRFDGKVARQRRADGRQQRAAHRAPGLGRRACGRGGAGRHAGHACATRWRPARSGVSSGLDYPPGAFATTDELAALTAEAAQHGGFYHTHVRYPLGDRYLDPFREAIDIGRRGGGPVHITHFYHRQTHPGGPSRCWRWSTTRAPKGSTSPSTSYPYEWASTRLLIQMPLWIQEGGPGPLKERLADRAGARAAARRAPRARRGLHVACRLGRCSAGRLHTTRTTCAGRRSSLADVMNDRGVDAVDAMCDLLLSEDLRVNQVTTGPWHETHAPLRRSSRTGCSAPTRRSSAPSRHRGPTARTRACWASSSASAPCWGSRRRSAR